MFTLPNRPQSFRRPRFLRSASLLVLISVLSSGCVFLKQVTLTNAQAQINNNQADFEDISGDGRYVVFSTPSAFESGDTNGTSDVYLRDVVAGTVERVSLSNSAGGLSNGDSHSAAVSTNGQFIAFASDATNLIPGGATGFYDEIYLRDRVAGTTTRVTSGNGESANADISNNGAVVVFDSGASNLVGGDTNNDRDVFRWQRSNGVTTRLSENSNGTQGNDDSSRPSTNSNGNLTAYQSKASSLVSGDTNGSWDVFVTGSSGVTLRVSTTAAGVQVNGNSINPRIDSTGVRIAFDSSAPDLIANDTNGISDVFLKNLTGPIERVSLTDSGTQFPGGQFTNSQRLIGMSGGANRIAFTSSFCLVGGCNTSLQIRNTTAATTTVYGSVDLSGAVQSPISNDGRYVAFDTTQQLVDDDTNFTTDVYIQTYPEPAPITASPSSVPRGQTTSVTIDGRGFEDVTKVFVSLFNLTTDDLYVSNINVIDDATITADITVLSTAPLGAKNLLITSPDGGPGQLSGALGICPACVTVTN